jgi:hypothetical protein
LTKKDSLAALIELLGVGSSINDVIRTASTSDVSLVKDYVPFCFSILQLDAYCKEHKIAIGKSRSKDAKWQRIVAAAAKTE